MVIFWWMATIGSWVHIHLHARMQMHAHAHNPLPTDFKIFIVAAWFGLCVWMKSAHRMSHFQANVYPLSFPGCPPNSYLCSLNLGSFTYLLSLLFHLIATKRNVHSSVSGQIDLKLVCSLMFVALWSVKLPIDQMDYLSFLTFGKNHYFVFLFTIHPPLPQALTTASNLLILLTIKHKLHPPAPQSHPLAICWTLQPVLTAVVEFFHLVHWYFGGGRCVSRVHYQKCHKI